MISYVEKYAKTAEEIESMDRLPEKILKVVYYVEGYWWPQRPYCQIYVRYFLDAWRYLEWRQISEHRKIVRVSTLYPAVLEWSDLG